MRLRGLFLWDIRFQAKYGFYFLYAVLTVIYTIIILAVPENWREKTATVLIFSDPAAMGLFFMGAIILLEKSQHTPCAFAVSPVRPAEYIISKVGSLATVSFVVAAALALAADVTNLCIVLLGTVISSTIFTLLAIIIATNIISLNQFILWVVPVEIICFVPAILHLFQITPGWLRHYPLNVCMEMLAGFTPSMAGIFLVMVLIVFLFFLSKHCVVKMWNGMGGVKL